MLNRGGGDSDGDGDEKQIPFEEKDLPMLIERMNTLL